MVKIDGKQVANETISKQACKNGWKDVTVDLSPYAGKSVKVELENRANGWMYEAGCWSGIAVKSE